MLAAGIANNRAAHMRDFTQWRWRLEELLVKINGELCCLWRAVDHEGEVLQTVVTAKRDKAARRIPNRPAFNSFPNRESHNEGSA
jgi:putative transposase